VLSLGQIQLITEYHSSYFQAWWLLHHVMGVLVSDSDKGIFFKDKKKQNTAISTCKILKPGSVYFPTDTGRQIHLSAGQ
jgi:hypothetical protein